MVCNCSVSHAVHLTKIVAQVRAAGETVLDNDLARIFPLSYRRMRSTSAPSSKFLNGSALRNRRISHGCGRYPYMDAVLQQLRKEGYPVRDEDVVRLSPFLAEAPLLRRAVRDNQGRFSSPLPARCPMPRQLVCLHGHRWDTEDAADGSSTPAVCPVCSASAVGLNPRTAAFVPEHRSSFTGTPPGAVTQPPTVPVDEAIVLPIIPGYDVMGVLGRGGMDLVIPRFDTSNTGSR